MYKFFRSMVILMAGAVGIIGIAVERLASSPLWADARPFDSADKISATGATGEGLQASSNSLAIVTQNLDKTVEWYSSYLGFRQTSRYSGVQGRVAVLERSGALLEVREDENSAADGSPGEPTIRFKLFVGDVDQEVHGLAAQGIEVLAGPRDQLNYRLRGALIRDVDGRVVGLRELLDE